MSYVCGWCREIYTQIVPGSEIYDEKYVYRINFATCAKCGNLAYSYRTSGIRNWAPPKKSNTNAWRLIRKGILLWDRRRVSRVRNRGSIKVGNENLGREATYGYVESPYFKGYGR